MKSRLPLLTGSEFVKILRPIPMTQLSHHTEDRQCPLCTDAYESSDEVPCGLACGHVFHQGCIENWVSEKKAKKYICPMCRRTLFAAFTHNTEQRRQMLIRSAINDARQQGVRSDIELYEVLRLRGSKMSPPNPQNAALGEAQDQRLTNELIYLDSFIFQNACTIQRRRTMDCTAWRTILWTVKYLWLLERGLGDNISQEAPSLSSPKSPWSGRRS